MCVDLVSDRRHAKGSRESLRCRDFEKLRGDFECPAIENFLNVRRNDRTPKENLTFRVYSGNSGYLPGLFQRRPATRDGRPQPHVGVDFQIV